MSSKLMLLMLLLLPQGSQAYHRRYQSRRRPPRFHDRTPPPPPQYKITNITDIEGEPEWKLLRGIVLPKPLRAEPARWRFICKYECDKYYVGEVLCFQSTTKGNTYIMPCDDDDNLDLSRMMAVFISVLMGCAGFCIIWCLCAKRQERIERDKVYKKRSLKIKELLTEVQIKEDEEPVDCPVCLDNIEKGVKTNCEHYYHNHCITTWLLKNNTCPLCKKDLFIAEVPDEPEAPAAAVVVVDIVSNA